MCFFSFVITKAIITTTSSGIFNSKEIRAFSCQASLQYLFHLLHRLLLFMNCWPVPSHGDAFGLVFSHVLVTFLPGRGRTVHLSLQRQGRTSRSPGRNRRRRWRFARRRRRRSSILRRFFVGRPEKDFEGSPAVLTYVKTSRKIYMCWNVRKNVRVLKRCVC